MRFAFACLIFLFAACSGPASQTTLNDTAAPTPVSESSESSEMKYTAWDTEPRLLNGSEVSGVVERMYPANLKEEGVDGRVVVWMYVDESGTVAKKRIQASSGYPELDQAAESVADSMRFAPAEYKGSPVSAWIAQPIQFTATE